MAIQPGFVRRDQSVLEREGPKRRPTPAAAAALREAVRDALVGRRMLDNVRRIGVAVSGGADSLALLDALGSVVPEVAPGTELVVLHINQHPRHQDPSRLGGFIDQRHALAVHILLSDTSAAAEGMLAQGKAPCRACAPVRAQRLGEAARDLRLDALALGHHLDDAAATLLMNIFHRGEVDTMRPVARRRAHPEIPVLRPMLFVTEAEVKAAAPTGPEGLFDCGMCSEHATERARASRYVAEMFAAHAPSASFVAELVASLGDRGGRRPAAPRDGRRA